MDQRNVKSLVAGVSPVRKVDRRENIWKDPPALVLRAGIPPSLLANDRDNAARLTNKLRGVSAHVRGAARGLTHKGGHGLALESVGQILTSGKGRRRDEDE